MKRKIIVSISALAIFALGLFLFNSLSNTAKKPPQRKVKSAATVYCLSVRNSKVPITVSATGRLLAKRRIELYAEVQGVMLSGKRAFKPGVAYQKGDVLVDMDSEVYKASIRAQKSSFQNLLSSTLADIQLDFPEAYKKWNAFAAQINPEKNLPPLPTVGSEQEKMFMSGKGLYESYYNLKNAELTLDKYQLEAPFSGILTDVTVSEGTLIRSGQMLGTFIQPTVFELEAPVNRSMVAYLSIGQTVELKSTGNGMERYQGKIIRINGRVNPGTQTVNVYIEVKDESLEEGAFLEAIIAADSLKNAFEISRSVLFNGNNLYTVKDSTLVQKEVEPLYFNENTVVIRGLNDKDLVVSKTIPGAYPGMRVKPIVENQ